MHAPRPRLQLTEQMSAYSGARKHVLVVDDQASQRRLLHDMLAPLGFVVSQAGGGLDCLEQLQREVPDLILLDIAMPDMDGWALARAIRARGHAQLPIIMVSANAFEVPHEGGDAALCNEVVLKPVSYSELLSKIRRQLQIAWVAAPAAAVVAPAAAADHAMPLSLAQLQALLELGQIGYVKGILKTLAELEQQYPACLPLSAELRQLLRQFRLNDYVNRIQEMIHHDLNQV